MSQIYRQVDKSFPEGQILPHCGGDTYLAERLVGIYHAGGSFPKTGNQALDQVLERLTQTDGYGANRK